MNRKDRRAALTGNDRQRDHAAVQAFEAAIALHEAGHLTEAVKLYRGALRHKTDATLYYNLGLALMGLGQTEEAAAAWRAACRHRPGYGKALSNLGIALAELDQLTEAEKVLREALVCEPQFGEIHNNLAIVLRDLDRLPEALAACRQTIALSPGEPDGHNSLGIVSQQQGDFDDALTAYRRALRLRPDFAKAHFNLGLLLLLKGELSEGWREHEWRWRGGARHLRPRGLPQPEWCGEPLDGRRLLLYAEQGYGDTLQFVRFAASAATLGGQVVLEAPAPLTRLLANVAGVSEIIASGDALPPIDRQLPLMSVPAVLGVTLDRIPCDIPYVQPDPQSVAHWEKTLSSLSGRKIGLVWSGDPRRHDPRANAIDRRRSMALSDLAPLLRLPGLSFVSLQMGSPLKQRAMLPPDLRPADFSAEIKDFADTAALIGALDLVISVDTAVAHLAGAMGKPVWILSRFDGCWRWLTDRDDSPWYPTARLFRQPAPGDWDSVVRRVARCLEEWGSAGMVGSGAVSKVGNERAKAPVRR
jgi:tetratricopeptide (TPR) repeat protein